MEDVVDTQHELETVQTESPPTEEEMVKMVLEALPNKESEEEVVESTSTEEAGELLSQEQRVLCQELATQDNINGLRAQALLLLDDGATQAEAAEQTNLTRGQVKYAAYKFRTHGLDSFTEEPSDIDEELHDQPLAESQEGEEGKDEADEAEADEADEADEVDEAEADEAEADQADKADEADEAEGGETTSDSQIEQVVAVDEFKAATKELKKAKKKLKKAKKKLKKAKKALKKVEQRIYEKLSYALETIEGVVASSKKEEKSETQEKKSKKKEKKDKKSKQKSKKSKKTSQS